MFRKTFGFRTSTVKCLLAHSCQVNNKHSHDGKLAFFPSRQEKYSLSTELCFMHHLLFGLGSFLEPIEHDFILSKIQIDNQMSIFLARLTEDQSRLPEVLGSIPPSRLFVLLNVFCFSPCWPLFMLVTR